MLNLSGFLKYLIDFLCSKPWRGTERNLNDMFRAIYGAFKVRFLAESMYSTRLSTDSLKEVKQHSVEY